MNANKCTNGLNVKELQKFVGLYTKEQLSNILTAWNVKEFIPTKNKVLTVNFPGQQLKKAEITYTDSRSTYGKRLYKIVMK